uniref:Putative secreted protein n=1 Tax=Ixodes ricinus TaxID=34613 RepID=A0A6B0U739_IXORI
MAVVVAVALFIRVFHILKLRAVVCVAFNETRVPATKMKRIRPAPHAGASPWEQERWALPSPNTRVPLERQTETKDSDKPQTHAACSRWYPWQAFGSSVLMK